MSVSVVVLNWNNPTDTVECIRSITKSHFKEKINIIICDNNSTDNSISLLIDEFKKQSIKLEVYEYSSHLPDLKHTQSFNYPAAFDQTLFQGILIKNDSNLGFAGGNNSGLLWVLKHSSDDSILLLNNDTILDENSINYGVQYLKENINVGVAGGVVKYFYNPEFIQSYGGGIVSKLTGRSKHLYANSKCDELVVDCDELKKLSYPLGAAIFISRRCLENFKRLFEGYFLYYEEIDLTLTIKSIGFNLGVASNSIIYHKEGQTIGSSHINARRSLMSEYYLSRSRVLFIKRWYPYNLPFVFLYNLVLILRATLKGDVKRSLVIFRATLHGITGERNV